MTPVAIAFSIAVPAAFVCGVIFHKYVASEASAIKEHVSAEVDEVRKEVSAVLTRFAGKL